MFRLERWQEIFESLGKNLLRSILTSVSVAAGIFILVILLGVSTGIQNGVRTEFEEDATNRLVVVARTTTKEYKGLNPGRRLQLRNSDFTNITERYEDQIDHRTRLYSTWGGQINYEKQQGSYRIEGAQGDQQFIENQTLVSGRFISQDDVDERRKVAVIGYQIKQDLFKKEEAVGKTIILNNNINYLVVGVYQDPGGTREESRVFIPITSAQQVFNAGDKINRIAYTVAMGADFDETVERSAALKESIDRDLRQRFTVAPDDRSAIRIRDTMEEAKKIFGLIDTIRNVFWFIGIGTIIAGVVGVGNIMIIIVKERTKEIGVRKALGAQPSEIIWMVLQEAIFLTLVAGLVGLFLGVWVLEAAGPLIQEDFIRDPNVDFNTSIATVIILVIAGAFAGFLPARRAANIRPIEALRDD